MEKLFSQLVKEFFVQMFKYREVKMMDLRMRLVGSSLFPFYQNKNAVSALSVLQLRQMKIGVSKHCLSKVSRLAAP